MGKHNARCTRRRAEPGVSARAASSREAYYASGTLGVSLPPAWHSAPPRCRLRITVAFSRLRACAPPSISESVDVWRIDGPFRQNADKYRKAELQLRRVAVVSCRVSLLPVNRPPTSKNCHATCAPEYFSSVTDRRFNSRIDRQNARERLAQLR